MQNRFTASMLQRNDSVPVATHCILVWQRRRFLRLLRGKRRPIVEGLRGEFWNALEPHVTKVSVLNQRRRDRGLQLYMLDREHGIHGILDEQWASLYSRMFGFRIECRMSYCWSISEGPANEKCRIKFTAGVGIIAHIVHSKVVAK